MKQNQEERTIQELFKQLRRDDESAAPLFVGSPAPASSRHKGADYQRRVRQAVAAVVVSLLLGVAWLIFSGRNTKTPGPAGVVNSGGAPAPRIDTPPPNPTPSSSEEQTIKPARQHRKQRRAQLRPETLLLSQWRSPTESLMRTPGEQFLKAVPRLNESLIEIK